MFKDGKKIKIYSALEVANLCGVVNQTAINWIKNGYLKAFTTPGGQYRVYADDLYSFLTEREMRIPDELKDVPKIVRGKKKKPKRKIMIIDDDKEINDLLKRYFCAKFPDFEIIQAFDGFEAGFSVGKYRPDVILLDLYLPGIDGFTLCRKIKEELNLKSSKIIAISGILDADIQEKIMESGADLFYKKPLDFNLLAADINNILSEAINN